MGGKLPGPFLIERPSLRRQIDDPGRGVFGFYLFNGPGNGFHLHHHALAPSVGGVIHDLVFIQSKIPDVDDSDLDEPFLNGLPQDALLEREKKTSRERGSGYQTSSSFSHSPSIQATFIDPSFAIDAPDHPFDRREKDLSSLSLNHIDVIGPCRKDLLDPSDPSCPPRSQPPFPKSQTNNTPPPVRSGRDSFRMKISFPTRD